MPVPSEAFSEIPARRASRSISLPAELEVEAHLIATAHTDHKQPNGMSKLPRLQVPVRSYSHGGT